MVMLVALSHHIAELSTGYIFAVQHSRAEKHAEHHRSVNIIKKFHMSFSFHWNALVSCCYETVFSVLRDVQHS